jgi:hypothetical protein
MKRLVIVLLLLVLPACLPQPLALTPPETLAAQTLAAMPKTDTPTPTQTDTPVPTATADLNTATPSIDLTALGAYCLPANTERTTGLVTRVLDSDVVEVASGNDTFRVRYLGLESPGVAPVMQWGPQAVATNERLVAARLSMMKIIELDAGATCQHM